MVFIIFKASYSEKKENLLLIKKRLFQYEHQNTISKDIHK